MSNKWSAYHTYRIYDYEYVKRKYVLGETHIDGASMKSNRVKVLLEKDPTCKCCGYKILFFAIQSHKGREGRGHPHLNAYTIKGIGNVVMMTRDHETPKSLGGSNDVSNGQVMCSSSNARKGSQVRQEGESEEEFYARFNPVNKKVNKKKVQAIEYIKEHV